jgi:putative heme-binding domain-containing protein
VLALLVTVGTPDDLLHAFEVAAESPEVLNNLAIAAYEQKRVPPGDHAEQIRALIASDDFVVREAAIDLAGAWKLKALAPDVRKIVQTGNNESAKHVAIGVLAELDGRDALPLLTPLVGQNQPAMMRGAAVRAITAIDVGLAAKLAAKNVAEIEKEDEARSLLAPLLLRRGGPEALAGELANVKLSPDAAKLAHRALSAAGVSDPQLLGVLNKAIGINFAMPEYDGKFVADLVGKAKTHGDAARGREVYLSKLANCAACHKLEGAGGDLGPDISSVGKSLSPELIVESVLWPHRQVKEGFVAVRVVTDDGQVYTGLVVRDSPQELELRDPALGGVVRIPKSAIEASVPAGSLMPTGLTAAMTSDEVRDLVRFLSDLGKK